jgi:hypothetical protein
MSSKPQRKPCILCGQEKPDDAFYWYAYTTQQGKLSSRRESRCKPCAQRRRRNSYAENPTKDNAVSFGWKTRNRESMLAKQAKYKRTHGRAICNAATAKRQAAQLQRVPSWADLKAIKSFYETAKDLGLAVDHVIPLQGKLVSGLHVQSNLQLLSKSENSRKKNNFVVA